MGSTPVRTYMGSNQSMFPSHIHVSVSVSPPIPSSLSEINKHILGWGGFFFFPKKPLRIELPYIWASNPHFRVHITKSLPQKAITLMFCCIFYNSQDMEPSYIPISGWVDKENMVFVYNGILFSHKKEILLFVTIWVDLEDIMLS